MFNPIPKNLELPDVGNLVLVFHQHLPEDGAAIESSTGYWDGRHFRRLTHKDDQNAVIRHPLGWEEIQPSPEAKAAIQAIKNTQK